MSLPVRDKWGMAQPVEKDWSQPWLRGLEYIQQEGTSYWRRVREKHGYSREDVEFASQELCWEEVGMFEDRPGMPSLGYVEFLAHLEGVSIGALLDAALEDKGREIMEDE